MMAMRVKTFNAYIRQIDRLEARDEMLALRVARVAQSPGPTAVKALIEELTSRARGMIPTEAPSRVIVTDPAEFNRIMKERGR
jgi:hypothetical protein